MTRKKMVVINMFKLATGSLNHACNSDCKVVERSDAMFAESIYDVPKAESLHTSPKSGVDFIERLSYGMARMAQEISSHMYAMIERPQTKQASEESDVQKDAASVQSAGSNETAGTYKPIRPAYFVTRFIHNAFHLVAYQSEKIGAHYAGDSKLKSIDYKALLSGLEKEQPRLAGSEYCDECHCNFVGWNMNYEKQLNQCDKDEVCVGSCLLASQEMQKTGLIDDNCYLHHHIDQTPALLGMKVQGRAQMHGNAHKQTGNRTILAVLELAETFEASASHLIRSAAESGTILLEQNFGPRLAHKASHFTQGIADILLIYLDVHSMGRTLVFRGFCKGYVQECMNSAAKSS
ncbi:hypothetical protein CANCADRAFT_125593 [Tortispora caseinolytica NRRL Y-17796]|uniref:Senescence domain-containing protein n=1 Tax=Tortispora caseinolytica NRRL Y-17796 TaxID=767744 RepID=A0A1E4TA05_9ASCO|nr:hypothetical protein CANCADRAFT_125593 [Tortispora caseinolytica NRRL Y-17796]